MKLRIIQGLLFLFISTSCYSTTTDNLEKNLTTSTSSENTSRYESKYAKCVGTKLKTKKQKIKEENLEETIIYLGDILLNGKLFHVLTSYREIQAALVVHGHSTIYILDSKKRIVKEYELGQPEELPFMVENNSLYFHFIDSKTNERKTYINKIEKELPKLMCVEPDDYY